VRKEGRKGYWGRTTTTIMYAAARAPGWAGLGSGREGRLYRQAGGDIKAVDGSDEPADGCSLLDCLLAAVILVKVCLSVSPWGQFTVGSAAQAA
jgi:hypothetical protein